MIGPVHTVEEIARPRKIFDAARVALRSTAGPDGHRHCVLFDENGRGRTSTAADGHYHDVRSLDILPAAGHTHGMGVERCPADHNARGNHVIHRRGRSGAR